MNISDKKVWKEWLENNQDPYGAAVVHYAERWANLMEQQMAEGKDLVKIAKETSHTADTEGITGFMYGAAVSVLATCWKHGEELRKWHNLDTQIYDEGERANEEGKILNPALLCIGTRQMCGQASGKGQSSRRDNHGPVGM